jgi:modification methylase
MPRKTQTSSFGVSRREAHDASDFYSRSLYQSNSSSDLPEADIPSGQIDEWADRIYNLSSESMPIPDNSIGLAFTSPPYNVGKDYDEDMPLESYLDLIQHVGTEVYRVLKPGGRYIVNVANLGRKPYIPMHAFFYQIHAEIGFLPMGEIIWKKGRGANGSCAWGSWRSASAPRLRDLHEYLLVFAKGSYKRPNKGISDLSGEEFTEATLSVWEILPVSAKKVGHPAPFPVELASRVVKLYSYVGDVVLDPFIGSGTTAIAARQHGRHYVGFDISPEYCRLAEERIANAMKTDENVEE